MAVTDTEMLANLEKRRQDNVGEQIDNARLRAGADMYYYCHGCGVLTTTKPEGWYEDPPPPKFCPDCDPLVEAGLMPRIGEPYDEWLAAQGKPRVPR